MSDTCVWCGAALVQRPGPGRRRVFCKRSHRQRYYEARMLGSRMGLGPEDVLLSRDSYRSWLDGGYVLEAALEDARRDLDEGVEVGEVLERVMAAAFPLAGTHPEPKAVGS